MTKKLAIVLAVLMVGFLGWVLLGASDSVSLVINGNQIDSPFGTVTGTWGIVSAVVILFCAAILLVFVFFGLALIVLGGLVLAGSILAAMTFPFLFPILIPLFVVWLFCCLVKPSRPPKKKR
ncbi:hypothetical protein ACFL3Q_12515 [Planctomycetota bacterium]